MEDKFKINKKWFWVGMVMGFLNGFAGLVFGIALVLEPEHRREGGLVLLWSVVMIIVATTLVRYFQAQGIIPLTPAI